MAKKKKDALQINVPFLGDAENAGTADADEAARTLELVKKFEITTQAELDFSVKALAEIKTRYNAIEAKRKEFVAPLNKTVKGLNAFFKPATGDLLKAETVLKGMIVAYHARMERERQKALELAAAAATATEESEEGVDVEEALEIAEEAVVEDVSGLSMRNVTEVTILDPAAIVKWCIEHERLELLLPNEKALKALGKASPQMKIDGLLIKETKQVAITGSKV